VAIPGITPSLLIPSGFVDIVFPDLLFMALLIVALFLLPPFFLLTPTLVLVVSPLFLVPKVPFSLISKNVLLGPLCTPLVFCFEIRL
jgi:hypothetical protein